MACRSLAPSRGAPAKIALRRTPEIGYTLSWWGIGCWLLDRLLDYALEGTMPEAYPLSLPSEPRTRAVVIRLVGEFDGFAERLFMTCVQHLETCSYSEIFFDFARVQFADASGIRCMLQAQRQLHGAGKKMSLEI